jgi:hypothetical protein
MAVNMVGVQIFLQSDDVFIFVTGARADHVGL